jgi:hypothetical protein
MVLYLSREGLTRPADTPGTDEATTPHDRSGATTGGDGVVCRGRPVLVWSTPRDVLADSGR